VEDVIGAVAVVDVPVEHQHSLGAVEVERVLRRDGDVVEQAKPHRARSLGVVTRRPQTAERDVRLAARKRIDRLDGSTGGVHRGLERARARDRVDVEHPSPVPAEARDPIDVGFGMHRLQAVCRDVLGLDKLEAEPVAVCQSPLDRRDAGHVLGVVSRLVFER
jgi:hypothetical protein